FPIPPGTLVDLPDVLEIAISRIVNEEAMPFSVFAYLSPAHKTGNEVKPALIGNFSPYPPDSSGRIVLPTRSAFRQLQAAGLDPKTHDMELLLEIRRVHESRAWTSISVTVAPTWKHGPD